MKPLRNKISESGRFITTIKRYSMTLGLIIFLLSMGNKEVICQIRPKSIRVTLYNEATSLPGQGLVRFPFHPGFSVGTDLRTKSSKYWQRSLWADLTFYHHKMSENAIMLDAIYSLGFKPGFGLQIKLIAGAGYKHSFLPGDVFEFENGGFRRIKDWGMSQFNIKLGSGLEFQINEKFSLTADHRFMVASPYSGSLPFSVHSFTGLGVKMNLLNDQRKGK